MRSLICISIFSIVFITCTPSQKDETISDNTTEEGSQDLTLASLGVDESFVVPAGLNLGAKAPGIGARDLSGNAIDLYTVLKEGPVVMVFYRGKWCTYCNKFMSNLNDSLPLIKHLGATVIAVTPEKRSNSEEMTEKNNLKFPIISDPGHNIMNAFDVTFKVNEEYSKKVSSMHGVRIAENNGTSEEFLPVPATYIISQDGTIIYRHFDFNFRKRAPISEVLEFLKALPRQ